MKNWKRSILIVLFILACIGFTGCSRRPKRLELPKPLNVPHLQVGEEKFYYRQLDEDEKEMYDIIYSAIMRFTEKVELHELETDGDMINSMIEIVLMDSPEIFWIYDNYTLWSSMNGENVVALEFQHENIQEIEEQKTAILAAAEEWKVQAEILPSEYEKVKYIYEQIILKVEYSLDSENNQNIRSVFLGDKSVCAGYAKAFKYMMDILDIESAYIIGEAIQDEQAESHAWNLVMIDGEYYWVDPTWGDPLYTTWDDSEVKPDVSYAYLCVNDTELVKTHTPWYGIGPRDGEAKISYEIPDCVDTRYDYYRLNENYIEVFVQSEIYRDMMEEYRSGKRYYAIKCANDEVYVQLYDALFETGALMSDVCQQIMRENGMWTIEYYYSVNERMNIIKIEW